MSRRLATITVCLIVALAVGVAVGWLLGGRSDNSTHAGESTTPADDSAEAGFVRDMATHHSQAVEMADIIRGRTTDPALQVLATDIVLTQQSQIGRFGGWLDQWGLPATSFEPPMAWSSEMSGHDMSGMAMPGMAEPAEVAALATLPLVEAETQFLELMIAHHRGGVDMAQAVLPLTSRPEVVRMAESIVRSQTSEIATMNDMLTTRTQPA